MVKDFLRFFPGAGRRDAFRCYRGEHVFLLGKDRFRMYNEKQGRKTFAVSREVLPVW